MADATPVLLVTNAGLAAASVATPQGPYIHITSFKIGSGYGYTPQPTDVDINGNLLYQGAPTAYQNVGNNTINIICTIPPDAGPWDFGEVGLFLDSGVMFAKAVFAKPQSKFSSLGTNVASAYVLNCLLKLQQSTAVFQISTIQGPPQVLDIYQWSDVAPPALMASPLTPLLAVHELTANGDATILERANSSQWSVGSVSYRRYSGNRSTKPYDFLFPVANSSNSWVEIAANVLHPGDLNISNRGFLLRTADGYFRSVNNVQVSGSNYRFNLNVSNDGTYNNFPLPNIPQIGSSVSLYRCDVDGLSIYYDQILDPPQLVPAGAVIMSAALATPSGYLYCNGQAVSRTAFASLYAAIGTNYGAGDGSTTFNVPDFRGTFARGWDNGRGLDPGRAFGTGGVASGFQADAFGVHSHSVSDPGHAHTVYDPGHSHSMTLWKGEGNDGPGKISNSYVNFVNSTGYTNASGTNIGIYSAATNISLFNSGGRETVPKNVAVNYFIKY